MKREMAKKVMKSAEKKDRKLDKKMMGNKKIKDCK